MSSKQWLGARSPGGQGGGATSIATVVLALTTAMALAGVSLVGVGQLTGEHSPASSDAIAPDQPPAPVEIAAEPGAAPAFRSGARLAAAPRPFAAAHEPVARSAAPRLVSVGGPVPRGAGESPAAAAPASRNDPETLVPTAAAMRVLSLRTPAAGATWSGVKNGTSWSGGKRLGKKPRHKIVEPPQVQRTSLRTGAPRTTRPGQAAGQKHFRSATKSKQVAKNRSTRPLKPESVTAGAESLEKHGKDEGAGRRK